MATIKPFDRITVDSNIVGGRPCIRGMRIQASLILNLVANGMTTDKIIKAYPSIEPKGSRKNNFTFLHLSFSPSLADTSLAPDLIKLAAK